MTGWVFDRSDCQDLFSDVCGNRVFFLGQCFKVKVKLMLSLANRWRHSVMRYQHCYLHPGHGVFVSICSEFVKTLVMFPALGDIKIE